VVAHLTLPTVPPVSFGGAGTIPLAAPIARLPLLLAAGVLYLGDTLTVALEISAITGERPSRVARMVVREGWLAEAMQYIAGLLGALVAREDAWAIILLLMPVVLVQRLLKLSAEMQDETRALLESMADAVDLRDPYTGGHSRRVTEYAAATLEALNLRGPEVELITAAARVHDIGKIAIPDRILNKPDRLTEEERAEMESHPQRGADFLARYADFRRGVRIVLHHHERIDGNGYPLGLRGDDIPFGARLIAVADAFDAMTSDRPYRKGMSIAQAAGVLSQGSGTQWDSVIVAVFTNRVIPALPGQGQAMDPAKNPATTGLPGHLAASPPPGNNAVA
jgi:HD-GYP domain-containing protein (c-di-GMP phosphodiesterase class II)